MHSLFSLRSKGNFVYPVIKNHFTTGVVNIGSNQVLSNNDKLSLNKIVERDVKYFIKLSEDRSPEEVLRSLHSIANSFDDSTKFGRDVINAKNEIQKNLIYHHRQVEDHENVSSHICEAELYKVYAEHIKEMDQRLKGLEYIKSKSLEESKLIYEYKSNLVRLNILY